MAASNALNLKKIISFLMVTVGLLLMCPVTNAEENSYRPDTNFLKNEPYRKSKARVELSGIKNDFELKIVEDSLNDVLRLVRLFGMGNKLPNGKVISKNTRLHPAFLLLTTERARNQIDIDPASNHIDQKIFNWNVESNTKFTVYVIFKHQPLSSGLAEYPDTRIYEFEFLKNQCGAKWCLNQAKKIG